jgi:hypothetical protein
MAKGAVFSSNFCEIQLRYGIKKVELRTQEKSEDGSYGIKNSVNGVADPD